VTRVIVLHHRSVRLLGIAIDPRPCLETLGPLRAKDVATDP